MLILRWYWWRITAWSEISAMTASFIVSMICLNVIPGRFPAGDPNADAWILIITVGVSTVIWVAVTFALPAETPATLESF